MTYISPMWTLLDWLGTPEGHVALTVVCFFAVVWALHSTDPNRRFR